MKLCPNKKNAEKGAALIVGVIFLIILSLFILGAMRDVLLQERMAGAYRNMSQAQSTSDSVLRNAESAVYTQFVSTGILPAYFSVDNESAGVSAALVSFRRGAGYIAGSGSIPNGTTATVPNQLYTNPLPAYANSNLARPGAYVVEGPIRITDESGLGHLEVHNDNPSATSGVAEAYRITARATGGSDSFVRASESTILVTH